MKTTKNEIVDSNIISAEKSAGSGGFLKSAALLTVGGIAAKIIGAVYRIPLTNMLGAYGIGLYQLAFPLYALLVTLSAAGIPTAVSKIVAEKTEKGDYAGAKSCFRCALLVLSGIGFVFGGILFAFAEILATVQNTPELAAAYRVVAAAIPAECVTAAFKGWFHGRMNMKPTAISQIIEQVVKAAVGLIAVSLCLPEVLSAVYAAVAAVTASETAGLIVTVGIYLFGEKRPKNREERREFSELDMKKELKTLLACALPMTLSAIVLPVAHLIDSLMVQKLIGLENRTELYGLWSGPVHSLITMPSVLITGVAASVVPGMARSCAAGDGKGVADKLNLSMALSFGISLPSAFGLAFLSEEVCGLLYPGFSGADADIFAKLLTVGSGSIIFMSVLMTANSVLQANGKFYIPVIALTAGSAVKCAMDFFLYRADAINIYEEAFSHIACNLVACIVNMWYIKKKLGLRTDWTDVCLRPLAATCAMTLFIVLAKAFMPFSRTKTGTILVIAGAGIVYLTVLAVFWREKIRFFVSDRKRKRASAQ